MNRYQFSGTIYPSGILHIQNLEFTADDVVGFDHPINGNLNLLIHDDNVIVKFDTQHNFDSDLDTLRKSLEYFSKTVIDSANYYFGTGVELYLTLGGNTSNQIYTFPPKVNSLFNEQSNRPLQPLELATIAVKNIQLRRVLEQAKHAITTHLDTGLHCYRAIEAIRKDFLASKTDDGTSKRKSWEDMNNALRIKQEYYSLIKEHADIARHGGVKSASSNEIEEMLHKTWEIIDRYIIFLKENNTPLNDTYKYLE